MATFLFAYRAPENYTLGRPEMVAAWSAWFESMGAALADRGNPVVSAVAVGRCGDGTRLGGYSLVEADDLDAATRIAEGCPALREGGGVEVGAVAVPGAAEPAESREAAK